MAKIKFKAYHGTDESVAQAIVENGFISRPNREHWLGEGIYFFLDKNLAEWWTTNPTKKSGMHIQTPVVIECTFEIETDKIFDLRNLTDYNNYVTNYNNFFCVWLKNAKGIRMNTKKLRCGFFNFMWGAYEIDAIIAPFILPDQPYMPQYMDQELANEMHIIYPEIQMCIDPNSQNLITKKEYYYVKAG